MALDEDFFARAVGRMALWMLVLAIAGGIAGLAVDGWRWSAGFLLGAGASALNFRWMKQIVQALGDSRPRKRPKARLAVFLGLRYALLGLATYVIFVTSALRVSAFLAGLFIAVAAVVMEILFELMYARI
ncbi:MAG TPA: ATP synthase subunit I [Phycisphaerae bacterium]|jgi:hypothetical protein|nr:ATP synthase subunit I [Phycisphaerae bacterium]